ncbi:MAG: RNA methyltransferase [Rhizobiales bacterium]|nr:RNA methyltransferase [Hyphomicrobiales bacterium]
MQPISSLQNPTIKLVRSLADKKGRRESGLFIAEGHAMLERAMDTGWVPEHVIATRPPHLWDEVRPLIITEKLMGELSAQNNPHEVLACFRTRLQAHPGKSGLWLALEEIRDPGNLGTIIRTADAAGAAGIILIGDCCDPFAPECVRATTGSIFAVPIVRMKPDGFAQFAAAFPGDVVGTAMRAKQDFKRSYPADCLLVLGSESRGLTDAISKACKQMVRIPMRDGVESLNVATAAALMLYQAAR